MPAFPPSSAAPAGLRTHRDGFALVMVLCCVVLLTALVVTFLSWSNLDRQISGANASLSTATLFGQGAIHAIVGDLQQEIVAGSTATPVAGGGTNLYLYPPVIPTAGGPVNSMVPATSGFTRTYTNNVESDGLANLLKVSLANHPFYPAAAPYTPTADYLTSGRASTASTTNTSLNGRSISAARWNQHLLLPQSPANSNPVDTTPTPAFPVPDWVLVARDGSDTHALSAPPTPTSTNAIVGRYAYAIYDEGGLLDANVAGSPSGVPTSWPGYKTALSYADLTQLPGMNGLSTSQQSMAINALVGWRNAASAHPTGTFPNYSFAGAAPTSFDSAVLFNYTGFLNVGGDPFAPGSAYNNQTDRAFNSRQALITFLTQGVARGDTRLIAAFQQTLQYLGTFSRDLNQPSLWPDPLGTRPKIASAPGAMATADAVAPYLGGNDQMNNDDLANPAFLTVRATTAFQRYDNGQNLAANQAVVGEPLVKHRFPLNRLAWLTYKGPSASLDPSDPIIKALLAQGISSDMIQQGTAANIKQCFGLKWTAATGTLPSPDVKGNCWLYQHDTAAKNILTLTDVQAAGREPDFAELLKAAIVAGSLGKGAGAVTGSTCIPDGPYNLWLDTTVDFQVMQIFANIIDQFDADSYPTWIQFNNGSRDPVTAKVFVRNFHGTENLPYLQQLFCSMVQVAMPSPAPKNGYVDLSVAANATKAAFPEVYLPGTAPYLNDPGRAVVLITPSLWNPYDATVSPAAKQAAGTLDASTMMFRITADGRNPMGTSDNAAGKSYNFSSANIYADPLLGIAPTTTTGTIGNNPVANQLSPARNINGSSIAFMVSGVSKFLATTTQPWNPANTQLTFSVPNTTLFREPTLLHQAGIPAGSALALGGSPGSGTPAYSTYGNISQGFPDKTADGDGKYYLGFYVADVPMRVFAPNDKNYPINLPSGTVTQPPATATAANPNYDVLYTTSGVNINQNYVAATFRLDYSIDHGQTWQTYDEKFTSSFAYLCGFENGVGMPNNFTGIPNQNSSYNDFKGVGSTYDPRTSRFGFVLCYQGGAPTPVIYPGFQDPANNVINNLRPSDQDDIAIFNKNTPSEGAIGTGGGWIINPTKTMKPGLLTQNDPLLVSVSKYATSALYYQDPDGVVRRASGAYYRTASGGANLTLPSAGSPWPFSTSPPYGMTSVPAAPGLPMVSSLAFPAQAASSRPVILNRPFHSVAELGYVFRGQPWKNLDFFTPQSGDAGLLDVFCVNDDNRPDALVAGKVNINTRQAPVLKAILAGAYNDELKFDPNAAPSVTTTLIATDAQNVANALVARTGNAGINKGPLRNIGELVGKPIKNYKDPYSSFYATPTIGYDGFSNDLTGLYSGGTKGAANIVQRLRETAMRALSEVGTARTWNLMIDVVAQTGRYPQTATGLNQFVVDGEQHYWVHVAIDRYTGQVIDQSIEPVKD